MIDQKAIAEFKELYFQEYGIKLTDQEAMERGSRLINMIKAVYGHNLPVPKKIDKEANKDHN